MVDANPYADPQFWRAAARTEHRPSLEIEIPSDAAVRPDGQRAGAQVQAWVLVRTEDDPTAYDQIPTVPPAVLTDAEIVAIGVLIDKSARDDEFEHRFGGYDDDESREEAERIAAARAIAHRALAKLEGVDA